jgi:signal transduction histidine kinase
MLPRVRNVFPRESPTAGLFIGLTIIMAVVVVYSWYVTAQVTSLQELQIDLVDRNRRDSLQLLRIQNDLNSAAHAMRDMLEGGEPYPLTGWEPQFRRIRTDLEDALRIEDQLAVAHRTAEQRQHVADSLAEFCDAIERIFALARAGDETGARDEIRRSLQARQTALSTTVARLLVQNNENEEQAAQRIGVVYGNVQEQASIFLAGTLAAILVTSLYLVRWNRRLFAELSALSRLRGELAQTLISSQESTLRYISRELHDEFGQVLTAMGSLLNRARRREPPDSPLRLELQEVCEIAQSTLDNVRRMSQALHPAIVEEAGLEGALDWFIPAVERHSGIAIDFARSGTPYAIDRPNGIHVFRILQEALNNATRHSGADRVWVRLRFLGDALELDVEDHGKGLPANAARGLGLIGMRERAEILGGYLACSTPREGGTRIGLRIPRDRVEAHAG